MKQTKIFDDNKDPFKCFKSSLAFFFFYAKLLYEIRDNNGWVFGMVLLLTFGGILSVWIIHLHLPSSICCDKLYAFCEK